MIRIEMCMDTVEHIDFQVVILVVTLVKFHLLSSLDKS